MAQVLCTRGVDVNLLGYIHAYGTSEGVRKGWDTRGHLMVGMNAKTLPEHRKAMSLHEKEAAFLEKHDQPNAARTHKDAAKAHSNASDPGPNGEQLSRMARQASLWAIPRGKQ